MSVDEDAREFGQHFKQGGWRLGLLVARSVYVSDDERGRSDLEASKLCKVTANQFADKAGVSARTVQLYYRAWELAADANECQHALDLSPGAEDGNVNFDEDDDDMRDKWSHYYRRARAGDRNGVSKGQDETRTQRRNGGKRGPLEPKDRLSRAHSMIEGIDFHGDERTEKQKVICRMITELIEALDTEVAPPTDLDAPSAA